MRRSRVLALVSLLVVVIVAAPAFAATQSITVMVPPWAEIPAAALQQFEKATGIHVNLNIVGWDQIRDKIAIAAVGGSSPADVVEVDWSWVGQLGDADWMMPLNQYVDDAMRSDIPSISIFTSGKDVIAVPYSNDLRIGLYNAAHFQKAGVAGPPQTWDAFVEAARKIKAARVVDYPWAMPLSATESTTTSFLLIALARSGHPFDTSYQLNQEYAQSTLELISRAFHDLRVLSPSMATMIDEEVFKSFSNGRHSLLLTGLSNVAVANDPARSQVVGQAKPMLIPGRPGKRSVTFGLPEAVGIPKYSKNKEAAWKFVAWFVSPETQKLMYQAQGLIPTRLSVMNELSRSSGDPNLAMIADQAKYVEPVFPAGTPSWYPQFSTEASSLINQMTTQGMKPDEVTRRLATATERLRKIGK